MVVLLGSVLIQQFYMKAPFSQYAGEFIAFFGISLYMVFRHLILGLNLFGEGKRAKMIPLLNSIVLASVVTTITGISNYSTYGDKYKTDGMGYFIAVLGVTFVSAWLSCFYCYLSSITLTRKNRLKLKII